MSKRNKNHNNEFLQLNDKKSISSSGGLDSKKSMDSKGNDFPSSYKANNPKNYQPDLLLENEEDPNFVNRNYWYRGELM